MGYKYSDLDYEADRQGSSDIPGRVYMVAKQDYRLMKGDLLLCLYKSGDNHYNYARIKLRADNGDQAYFSVVERVTGYGGRSEAFPEMRTFTPSDLVHILTVNEALINSKNLFNKEDKERIKHLGEVINKAQQEIIQLSEG